MAKWPLPGKVKTRLEPALGPREAARLYTAFVADLMVELSGVAEATILVLAGGSGRPSGPSPGTADTPEPAVLPDGWLRWPVVRQRGQDLGARLLAAFEDLGAGTRPVVLVGADHPDLPRREVDDAFAALGSSDLVLGPTLDGGYYLIGLNRPVTELFHDMPWSTPDLLRATIDRALALELRARATRPWYDIDRPADLPFLRQHLRLVRAVDPSRLKATARVLRELEDPEIDPGRLTPGPARG
jgi:rSAM/selenodomain-associated transferase 1